MRKSTIISILALGVMMLSIWSCKDDTSFPNLYSNLYDIDSLVEANPVPGESIEGLHRDFMESKCANQGCHDGAFEPDFRTIQSTYTTLVNATVIKEVDPYEFRVVPGDTGTSWLWNRVTTEDSVLGKMPLYDHPLTTDQLNNLQTWIMDGAKDMFGRERDEVNRQPYWVDFGAFDMSNGDQLEENARYYSDPFPLAENTDVEIKISAYDYETSRLDLSNAKIYFSTVYNDFSSAVSIDATVLAEEETISGVSGRASHKLNFNSSQFPKNTIVWMRLAIEDGDHTSAAVTPENGTSVYTQMHFSFIVE